MTPQIQQFIASLNITQHDVLLFAIGMIVGGLLFGGHARRAYGWGHRQYRRYRGYY